MVMVAILFPSAERNNNAELKFQCLEFVTTFVEMLMLDVEGKSIGTHWKENVIIGKIAKFEGDDMSFKIAKIFNIQFNKEV